ncbi:MAG: hypothetical protein Q9162_002898 [Coniocarpon cinnabarinum]
MTSVQDSVIFGNILSTQDSAYIWSDARRTEYYLRFEAGLARAQSKLGLIPCHAAEEIAKACHLGIIDWDELRRQTELIGYPVLPVVKQVVSHVNATEPGLGEWAHWGATTQDVTDTVTILQLQDTLDLVDESLGNIQKALVELCQKYKSTPMPARSNLQQAVPVSFGFKLARLLATFKRHSQRLVEVRTRLLVLEFGGAAGTLATLSPNGENDIGFRCQEELAQQLELAVPEIAWHTERDRIAEVGALFSLLTGTCAKFATDLKLLMQSEIGEASEPYIKNRGSSSTMPQKRNPIGCAYITATAAVVKNLNTALADAMVEDHERSTGPWEIEWIVLLQICTLTHATLSQTRALLDGLEVHEVAMRKNLGLTRGTIVSEAVMMGLGPTLGRQRAHDLVYDLCRESAVGGRPLIDLLDACEAIKMPRQELEKLCNPRNYLGLSEKMTDRVVKDSR